MSITLSYGKWFLKMGISDCIHEKRIYRSGSHSMNINSVKQTGSWLSSECDKDCIFSSYLFKLYAKYILREVGVEKDEHGFKTGGRKINNLHDIP